MHDPRLLEWSYGIKEVKSTLKLYHSLTSMQVRGVSVDQMEKLKHLLKPQKILERGKGLAPVEMSGLWTKIGNWLPGTWSSHWNVSHKECNYYTQAMIY